MGAYAFGVMQLVWKRHQMAFCPTVVKKGGDSPFLGNHHRQALNL